MARLLILVSLFVTLCGLGVASAEGHAGAKVHVADPPKLKTKDVPVRPLPTMNITGSTFTLSGISAGSAMAVQFQIAYSSLIRAAGTIAGIPYMCAGMSGSSGAMECMNMPMLISESVLLDYIYAFADTTAIDNPSNLKNQMTMVFSGTFDTVVQQGTVKIIDQMYEALGVPTRYQIYNMSAEHAWITDSWGQACSYLGSPYVNNCEYDFAGNFLQRAWDFMGQPSLNPRVAYNASNLFKFDQTPYGASSLISLDQYAFAYIPTACQSGTVQCSLHINFHGCNQMRTAFPFAEDTYVANTGLNNWAEANNIVILYPQTIASQLIPFNPQGCFDWWGYTDAQYAQQAGVQIQVIRKMIRTIGGF